MVSPSLPTSSTWSSSPSARVTTAMLYHQRHDDDDGGWECGDNSRCISAAVDVFRHQTGITIRQVSAVSSFASMHEDVCNGAADIRDFIGVSAALASTTIPMTPALARASTSRISTSTSTPSSTSTSTLSSTSTSTLSSTSSTRAHLRDRVVSRSADHLEAQEIRERSLNDMCRELSWFDLVFLEIRAVVGAGIFVLTCEEARLHAGPAIIISYAISGLAAMLSVLCYAEFAVDIPFADRSFAYLRVELGNFFAFIAAGNILFKYVITDAAVSHAWSSYLATLFN